MVMLHFAVLILATTLSGVSAVCDESQLVKVTTDCAKSDNSFLQCVAREQGPKGQCTCLRDSPNMKTCIGQCYENVELALCGDVKPAFQPANSNFLQYSGTSQPLAGIDGIYVLNLPRRSDRLTNFYVNSTFRNSDVHVQNSFDCQHLEWSDGLRTLFKNNTYGSRRALVAQALTHFVLWRHIASTTNQFHLILEDDALLAPDFISQWNQRYSWAFPLDAGVVYLGGVRPTDINLHSQLVQPVTRSFASVRPNTNFIDEFDEGIDTGDAAAPAPYFPYETTGYIISSAAARQLEILIGTHGFHRPVGSMLAKISRQLPVYISSPLLVTANDADDDGDIHLDYTAVPEPGIPPALSFARPSRAKSRNPLPAFNTLKTGWMLPTFVISVNGSEDRISHFNASVSKAGLRYKHFEAVDGATLNAVDLVAKGILSEDFPSNEDGTAGQALSHLLLHETMPNSSFDASIIFEDDAIIETDILARIDLIFASANPSTWDILSLDCSADCNSKEPSTGPYFISDTNCLPSLHAYVVSRQGSATLLAHAIPLNKALANQLGDHVGSGLTMLCARPHLAAQANLRDERETRNKSKERVLVPPPRTEL